MRLFSRISVLAAMLTGGCLLLTACVAVPAAPITYIVTPGKDDVEVSYQASGGDVTVEVRSPSGIGSAQLSQTGGPAPVSMTIRLYLKGLEQFIFEYPAATITVEVSSHDGSVSETAAVNAAAAQPIAADSPYWMPVRISATDPSIPLKNGYFEMQASKDFLAFESRGFSLRCVDFYR